MDRARRKRRRSTQGGRETRAAWILPLALVLAGCAPPARSLTPPSVRNAGPTSDAAPRVIIVVWDGLRPDSIDPAVTPQLARLRDLRGVDFRNHHAVFPTFTMMNAAAIATGARAGRHGFYGNVLYQPGPTGQDAEGEPIDASRPLWTEDHAVLQSLDAFARRTLGARLLRIDTLFEAAHAHGLRTAVIGKAGPAFLQDYSQDGSSGVILDENVVLPRAFGLALQAAGQPLPRNSVHQRFPDGPLELSADNGDPTGATEPSPVTLSDGVTTDPRASGGSPHKRRTSYLMRVFLEYVLTELDPALSMLWFRNPDSTQHSYGPGTPNAIDALRHQDQLLGQLLATLERLGRMSNTTLLIASDHGHSTVASDARHFPPRALVGEADGRGRLSEASSPGYAVSGEVRTADILRRAGFAHVYDGGGCIYNPVMGGLDAGARPLNPERRDEGCEDDPRYSTASFDLPERPPLPSDAIVIAANGGSEYFYVPSRDASLVRGLVAALQRRKQYGPIFVRSLYGPIAGTLSLATIGLESERTATAPTPDVIVSFASDELARTAASPSLAGTEHSSPLGARGMHGTFSATDVRATLIAVGPDFRAGLKDELPSSTLDIAPTIAALLRLPLPQAEGRVLDEAFRNSAARYRVEPFRESAGPIALDGVCDVDDPDCKRAQAGSSYQLDLYGQTLVTPDGSTRRVYLDKARVTHTAK